MTFTVLIPARLASSRLPDKPLADLCGKPMIVRVAEAAALAGANRVAVATDAPAVVQAVRAAGFEAVLTRVDHPSGTDRLAEASQHLGLGDDEIVVNLQGDEPLMPPAVCAAVAHALTAQSDLAMSTAAHAIASAAEFSNPNVVKVVCSANDRALYFSRATIPFHRDGSVAGWVAPADARAPVLRHVGIYAYRAGFLRRFPQLAPAPLERAESLEQLRALWHGHPIGVVRLDEAPPAGVDTPDDLVRVRALLAGR